MSKDIGNSTAKDPSVLKKTLYTERSTIQGKACTPIKPIFMSIIKVKKSQVEYGADLHQFSFIRSCQV